MAGQPIKWSVTAIRRNRMDEADSSTADAATDEWISVLAGLDSAQRSKFQAMFVQCAGTFFFAKWKLACAGATYEFASAPLYPTQRFLDIIATVRAGDLDWNVE